VRDLNLLNVDLEPRRGPAAVVTLLQRGQRWALRPVLRRLSQILHNLADRLDAADARFHKVETRIDGAESRIDEARLQADKAHDRIDRASDTISHSESRLDQAESRLDQAEWHLDVLRQQVDGMSSHLQGLTGEHHDLNARFESSRVQLAAIADSVSGLGRRQDELAETLQAFNALHWDHVALARRLALIEDLLVGVASPSESQSPTRPSIPFPGLDDNARTRVG